MVKELFWLMIKPYRTCVSTIKHFPMLNISYYLT